MTVSCGFALLVASVTVSCVLDILVLLLDTFVCFIVASAGLLGVVPAWSLPLCLVDANFWTTLAWSLVECCSLFPLCCLQLDSLSSTGSTVALPLSLLFIASVCCYYYLLSFLQSSLSFGEQSVRQSTCNQSLTFALPLSLPPCLWYHHIAGSPSSAMVHNLHC